MTMPMSVRKVDGGKIKGPQNVPNVIEVRMRGVLPNTKPYSYAVHGHFTTPPSNMQTLAGALWSAISSAWTTNLASHMHVSTSLGEVDIRDMTSYANPVFISTGTGIIGTGPGAAMPPNNAIVLTEEVAARGKGIKGRLFISGFVSSEDITSGGISPTVQAALNAYGTALMNALNSNSLSPCVAQVPRQQYTGLTGTVHPARAGGFIPVTSIICRDLIWDTQRRRAQL